MLFARWIITIVSVVIANLGSLASASCGSKDAPCEVASGKYYIYEPESFAKSEVKGALVYFHGWKGKGWRVIENKAFRKVAERNGILLIGPHGAQATWSHVGSPGQHRDEIAFMDAVMDDLAVRYDLDPRRIYATGFSQGGSMVWDLACYRSGRFAAFLPVAGGFWEPFPESCDSGIVKIRHIHGTADRMVPFDGRTIGGGRWTQGNIREGMKRWYGANQCGDELFATHYDTKRLQCTVVSQCAAEGVIELCLHEKGHSIRAEWLTEGIKWADSKTLN